MKRDGIKMQGWIGKWYIIDEREYRGEMYYMLEHETYGDETEHLIVIYRASTDSFKLILDEVFDGWENLEEAMEW